MYIILVSGSLLLLTVSHCQQTSRIVRNSNFDLLQTFSHARKSFQILKISSKISEIQCQFYDKLLLRTLECLNNFYVQVNHQPIIFTTYGFYIINFGLLASIITGMVSYQIILVQFYAS